MNKDHEAAIDHRFVGAASKDAPHPFAPTFADAAAWERRASRLRRQVQVALGLWPMPPRPPLKPVVRGGIDRGDYIIEKVCFASLPGHYVTGNLYRPAPSRTAHATRAAGNDGRLPAVLFPHGHWDNGRLIWREDAAIDRDLAAGAERSRDAARSPLQANCAMLARMGCIVFHYDMVGYADSRGIEHREGFLDAEAVGRLQSVMGLQVWNGIRAIDFVCSLPAVDSQRIAVSGSSGGGTQTIALGALDDRIAVSFPMVMVSMNMQGGCVCENAPLLRIGTNNVELACLFAPRPHGAASANDWTHDFLARGLPEMKAIWGLYGRAADVEGNHVDFGHNHNVHSRELQYRFLNRRLRLGWDEPVVEQAFDPAPPGELSGWDAQNPPPTDIASARDVRAWMARSSDAHLAELDVGAYATTVRAALAAMIVDDLPSAAEVVVDARQHVMARRGSGERIPIDLINPPTPRGDVLVWAHAGGIAAVRQQPEVRRLLAGGWGVAALDCFASEHFRPDPPPVAPTAGAGSAAVAADEAPYAGMVLGYNRSVIANRVHDLLSLIAWAAAQPGVQRVHLLGAGPTGPSTLLARALAGDAIDRAAIDLDGFDFDRIRQTTDPMLLPGALKYGGIAGFIPLCSQGSTLICRPPASALVGRAQGTPGVRIEPAAMGLAEMVAWLMT